MELSNFPKEIQAKAISLSEIGVSEFAWESEDVKYVIEFCQKNSVGILGGDVLEVGYEGQIRFLHTNWYLNSDQFLKFVDFVDASCKLAKEKVELYTLQYPDKLLLYSLVITKNIHPLK